MLRCYLLTLWGRKLVHYLTCSWWLIAVQEVWQSHHSLSCSVGKQPSCTFTYPLAPGEKNQPVSSRHKLWGSDSWADTQRPFGSKNPLAHCSYACWWCLVSIACNISRGLARYIVSNIPTVKMLRIDNAAPFFDQGCPVSNWLETRGLNNCALCWVCLMKIERLTMHLHQGSLAIKNKWGGANK